MKAQDHLLDRRSLLRALRIALLALLAAGCAARPPLTSAQLAALDDPPPQVRQKVERFSPPTVEWIERVETDFQSTGRPLTPPEIQMATEIGVKEPEKIRVVVAKTFPLPDDPTLRNLLISYGLGSPNEGGRTMGMRCEWCLGGQQNLCAQVVGTVMRGHQGGFASHVRANN
jgi:hypothetical protein